MSAAAKKTRLNCAIQQSPGPGPPPIPMASMASIAPPAAAMATITSVSPSCSKQPPPFIPPSATPPMNPGPSALPTIGVGVGVGPGGVPPVVGSPTTVIAAALPPGPPSLMLPKLPSQPLPAASDQVQSAVVRYLQKRRFSPTMTDAYKKFSVIKTPNGASLRQSKQQFALREVLRSEASSLASLALSSPPNVDPRLIEQQYTNFKLWISESPDCYKPELAQLLYPLFTYLYLDLITSGHKVIAQKFHKRHQNTFLGNANLASFLKILASISTLEEAQKDEAVNNFLTSKYVVSLTNKTFHHLMRHLQSQQTNGQPPILLHVLHTKLDVRLADPQGASGSKGEAVQRFKNDASVSVSDVGNHNIKASLLDGSSIEPVTVKKEPENGITSSSKVHLTSDHGKDSMAKLESVIKAVRSGPTPLPSACLYRLTHVNTNITCSAMASKADIMVTGCDDSSLILWDLLPPKESDAEADGCQQPLEPTRADDLDQDPSSIRLGCDQLLPEVLQQQHQQSEHRKRKSTLRGHSGPVYDATFLPKSKFLMSVSEDTTTRLWDVRTGLNKAVYNGHSYPIWSVDSDPVGSGFATGSMDSTVKLWSTEYAFPLRVLVGHERDVDVVKYHPNANYLATGSSDKTVRLWSHSDARMVRVFNGHRGAIFALAFSPDGKLLASAGEDRRIKVWDLSSSCLLKELKGHTDTIYSLVWSLDSGLLASGGMDGNLKLWDIKRHTANTNMSPNNINVSPTVKVEDSPTDPVGGGSRAPIEVATASVPTMCSNLLDMRYSPHNTLLVTGIAQVSSTSSSSSGMSMANGQGGSSRMTTKGIL